MTRRWSRRSCSRRRHARRDLSGAIEIRLSRLTACKTADRSVYNGQTQDASHAITQTRDSSQCARYSGGRRSLVTGCRYAPAGTRATAGYETAAQHSGSQVTDHRTPITTPAPPLCKFLKEVSAGKTRFLDRTNGSSGRYSPRTTQVFIKCARRPNARAETRTGHTPTHLHLHYTPSLRTHSRTQGKETAHCMPALSCQ